MNGSGGALGATASTAGINGNGNGHHASIVSTTTIPPLSTNDKSHLDTPPAAVHHLPGQPSAVAS
jgi:hypothetical protein